MSTTVSAVGIHDHPKYKLGAAIGPKTWDEKTLKLANFLDTSLQAPVSYDFDAKRKPFPPHMWGNDVYGDCEVAARANYLQRLQRAQTKTTPGITDDDVINLYKQMTGCVSPGDANDTGMTTLQNLQEWRSGWSISKVWQMGGQQTRDYTISAYGYINPADHSLSRLATYLFSGVLLGVNLPISAQTQTNNGVWDVVSPGDPNGAPGSWGGHCVLTKRYDADNVYVLTWGMEIRATNAWMDMYCVEGYSVIDTLDPWFSFPQVLNVQSLEDEMKQIGVTVQT